MRTELEIPRNAPLNNMLKDFLSITTYGDDNVIGIDTEVFNGALARTITLQNLQKTIKDTFGLDYTDADKSLGTEPNRPWEEVYFLRRRFPSHGSYHQAITQAPLETFVVEQMIFHFRPRPGDNVEAFNDVLRAAEQEACRLGEDEYNRIARALNRMIMRFPFYKFKNPACAEVVANATLIHRFRKYHLVFMEMLRTPPSEYVRVYEHVATQYDGSLPPPPFDLYNDDY